ncbi:Peptidoglycan/xylan/chitin deacetylase, PgdA/CDA1 family [Caloramator quimbayensis]|uniref:Peptidoglycan/xylan/chitin deacetylase, PgdA/CDA1 family n=1 Tax=Caloramator quimbayensis TaxID=1147123 RepID=A0A1T4XUF6_9CLOT|nr:polysaccharide deacetylase family protein [Caloramator quimbayensis]SKA93167.1 Peptidoglycan/xylan/chitin deacetylase, PgdA/CDA1 family [Caloramator quimbayensis]
MKKRKIILILFCFFILIISCNKRTSDNKTIKNKPQISQAAQNIKDEGADDISFDKVIYLTFDDGPSKVTSKILDILKEKNIKATFFIVGKEIPGNEDILKKIYSEGHSIGLHSYSHNYRKIYSKDEVFIEEMIKTQQNVKDIVGISPNIIRFPGGSKNNLDAQLLDKLHSLNFKIYDWNVSGEDGTNPSASPYTIYKSATKFKNPPKKIILLLHSGKVNKNTINALPDIIKYYKDKGYTFKSIDNTTPEYIFKIKKK